MSAWRKFLDENAWKDERLIERRMQKLWPGAYILVWVMVNGKSTLVPKFRDKQKELVWLLRNS